MAEGHIDDATISEMLQVLQFSVKGNTVLDAKHDAFTPCPLVLPQVSRSTGDAHIVAVISANGCYLVKDMIGIGSRILRRLWQISHHDRSIEAAFGHLGQINENARVALIETDTLREEHGRVAMGVEGENTVVHTMGIPVARSLTNQPLEQGESALHTLWVPLHTQDRLELRTLNGLDNAVGCCGNGAEP